MEQQISIPLEDINMEQQISITQISSANIQPTDVLLVKVGIGNMPTRAAEEYMDRVKIAVKQSLGHLTERIVVVPDTIDVSIMQTTDAK